MNENGTHVRHVAWEARRDGRVWSARSHRMLGSTVTADTWEDLCRLVGEHMRLHAKTATSWVIWKPS